MQSVPEDKSVAGAGGDDNEIIFPDLLLAGIDPDREWKRFQPGVDISTLYAVPGGMASAFLRFAPGSVLPRHCHVAHEHIFILRGSQQDENGVYRAGTMLLHPPDTCHSVSSPEGCLVLAIWGKPVTFVEK